MVYIFLGPSMSDSKLIFICHKRIIYGVITLEINIKSVIAPDHGMTIFPTQLALKTISGSVGIPFTTAIRWMSPQPLSKTILILRKTSYVIVSSIVVISMVSSCHICTNEINFRYCVLEAQLLFMSWRNAINQVKRNVIFTCCQGGYYGVIIRSKASKQLKNLISFCHRLSNGSQAIKYILYLHNVFRH